MAWFGRPRISCCFECQWRCWVLPNLNFLLERCKNIKVWLRCCCKAERIVQSHDGLSGASFPLRICKKNSKSRQNVCVLWDYFVLFVRRAWNRACKATLNSSLIKLKGGRGHNEPLRRWVTHGTAITHIKHAYKRQQCAHIHTQTHTEPRPSASNRKTTVKVDCYDAIYWRTFCRRLFFVFWGWYLIIYTQPEDRQTWLLPEMHSTLKNSHSNLRLTAHCALLWQNNPLTTKHFAHHPVPSAVEWPQEEEDWMQAGKSEVKGVKQRVARARWATPLLSVQVSSLSFVWTEQGKKKKKKEERFC